MLASLQGLLLPAAMSVPGLLLRLTAVNSPQELASYNRQP
jgi:hypothetical protein